MCVSSDIEATGLGVGEQSLDASLPAIEIEAASGVFKIGHDDEQFALLDTSGGYVQPVFRSGFHPVQSALPCAALAQKSSKLSQAAILKAKLHIFLKPDGKGNIVFLQEFYPFATDELPVGQQRFNG